MKSEERHDLEMNYLAKYLMQFGEKIGPYASYIIYGGLALVAAWAIYSLSAGAVSSKDEAAWDSYSTALLPGRYDTQSLQATADKYAGKPVGDLAKMAWADGELSAGCQMYFSNKDIALERIDDALAAYETLATGNRDKLLKQRAQLGVAQALEAKGEIDKAIAAYGEVAGPYTELAEARIKTLEENNAADYAGWLATAVGSTRPTGFGGSSRPEFMADQLGLPEEGFPGAGETPGEDFLELLRKAQESLPEQGDTTDRYESEDAAADESATDEASSEETSTDDSDTEADSKPEAETEPTTEDEAADATDPESGEDEQDSP